MAHKINNYYQSLWRLPGMICTYLKSTKQFLQANKAMSTKMTRGNSFEIATGNWKCVRASVYVCMCVCVCARICLNFRFRWCCITMWNAPRVCICIRCQTVRNAIVDEKMCALCSCAGCAWNETTMKTHRKWYSTLNVIYEIYAESAALMGQQ